MPLSNEQTLHRSFRMSMNGKKLLLCKPFLYKSSGGRLLVAIITIPCSNRCVNSRLSIIASPMSTTLNAIQLNALFTCLISTESAGFTWNSSKQRSHDSFVIISATGLVGSNGLALSLPTNWWFLLSSSLTAWMRACTSVINELKCIRFFFVIWKLKAIASLTNCMSMTQHSGTYWVATVIE